MTEQFTFVSCSHIFYLTRFYWENCCLQILRNTVTLNSYLGLSALSKNFIQTKKIFLLSAERPRYEFRATVLRRICKQQFSR